MIERILVAVDDTRDSLAAARVAVELATALHAELRAGHVAGRGAAVEQARLQIAHTHAGDPAAGRCPLESRSRTS